MLSDKRIRWLCRRGMKELDLIITRFYEDKFPHLSVDEQETFIDLLAEEDPDIYSWLMGRTFPQDKKLIALLDQLRVTIDQPVGS